MSRRLITLHVNGEDHTLAVEPQWTLAEVLREQLRLTGVKIGCDHGDCGACTVLADGKPILSCITLAATMEGVQIETIENVAKDGQLDPLQKSFIDHGAVQCGFCTPGMLLTAKSALRENPELSGDEVRDALSGNLCRCTGYQKIVDAVECHGHGDCGKHNVKVDAVAQVTGGAAYTDDMTLPRMLFGKILRSPHPHARILSIDTSEAENLPGVVAVMTGKELPVVFGVLPTSQDETALCIDKVRFVGDEVAAVAAVDEATAQHALRLIKVEYEVLQPVLSIDDALRPDLPQIHQNSRHPGNSAKRVELEFGDVEEGFAEGDYVREDDFFYGANTHAMMEPHAALASFEPPRDSGDYREGHLTLWSATQAPHYVHQGLTKVLGMPASHIRVIKPQLGGGFGGKSEPFALEFCAAWLSIKTGRPVKITYTREEVFYSHRGRHAVKMRLKTGVKRDGTITAVQYQAWLDGGAYGSYGVITSYYTGQLLAVPYRLPRFKFQSTRLYTNRPPAGPKRGHGGVQARFAFEAQLDRIAEEIGMDPAELRLRNAAQPNSMTINDLRITSCGLSECIETVVGASGWKNKHRQLPRGRGIGIASSAYISGSAKEIVWLGLPHSGAIVKIDRGGGVTVQCGSSDIGQGSNTVLASLTAQTLGISIDNVRVFEADTDLTPVDLGSYSSRVTFMAGNAVLMAARALKDKLLNAAAEKLKVPADSLNAGDGFVFAAGDPSAKLSFIEAARAAEAKYGTLSASGWYAPPPLGGTYKGAGAGPSPSYSFTSHIVELSVDEETGHVTVHKVWSAHDCGQALNRIMVEGQVEGSVYMGLGEVLYESLPFTRRTATTGGLLKNVSLLDYKIPTALDTPEIEVHIVESHDPEGPLGAKEAGEGPLLGVAAAVANAIYDAVGVRLTSVPFTPESILSALAAKRITSQEKTRTSEVAA